MFGLGWPEVGVIAIVAILIFGLRNSELGSALGCAASRVNAEPSPGQKIRTGSRRQGQEEAGHSWQGC